MKYLFHFLLLTMGSFVTLSASPSVNPQDPAFLDAFNASQKAAIATFLNEATGNGFQEHNAALDDAQLKQLYVQHVQNWKGKVSIAPKFRENINHATADLKEGLWPAQDCEKSHHEDPPEVYSITAHDIGKKGITLKRPGHYVVNVKHGIFDWNPAHNGSMIRIKADNVVLDLNGTTFIQKSGSSYASNGIDIYPTHQNITIRNGSFQGFTSDTIVATSTTNLFINDILISNNNNREVYDPALAMASINLLTCINVILKDISISNSSINSPDNVIIGAGILVFNTETYLIQNCEVVGGDLEANTLSQFVGISNILSRDGVIVDCRVSNCSSGGIMPGFGYVLCQNILTKQCSANYNTGIQTTSGYYPQFSNSLQFIDCEANSNHSTCQDCHGFPYFISTNGLIKGCRAINNTAVNPSGGFNEKMTGFEILVCLNCIVENCEAYNNVGTNLIRHYAAGFANGNTLNVVFRNCISIGNIGLGNESRGVGFGPALDPRFFGTCLGTIWDNCIAEGNIGDMLSVGFDLFGQQGAILTNSTSQGHGSEAFNNGIGIFSNGPYDQGNAVDVPCNVVPIVIMADNTENNVLVKNNTVTNNSAVGIVDATDANNVYINNIVFNNGTNFIGPIFAAGTPIREWIVGTAPSDANNNGVVGDKLDNLDIAP